MKNAVSNHDPRSIQAVIVAYKPDVRRLALAIKELCTQVGAIVVVDNGGAAEVVESLVREHGLHTKVRLVGTGTNVGVAAAQNQGIRLAMDTGAHFVLLLDQDSVPVSGMVVRLFKALHEAGMRGERIAAAAPLLVDERSGAESPFVQVGLLGFHRVSCAETDGGIVHPDIVMASGMLIPAQVLKALGFMDEALFIDHVDTEWCLRARSQGYRLLGVCCARLSHQLGEGSVAIMGRRRLFTHAAKRRYFIFRNSILLYRRGYPLLRWKIADALRLAAILLLLATVASPRRQHLRAAFRGLIDGCRGVTGSLPASLDR